MRTQPQHSPPGSLSPGEAEAPETGDAVWAGPPLDTRVHRFAAHHTLPRHAHPKPAAVVVMNGGFEAQVAGRRHECVAGDIAFLPADVAHAEKIGPAGSRSLIMMPLGDSFEHEHGDAVPELAILRGPSARRLAWRVAVDWHARDATARLGFEHHVEELFLQLAGKDEDSTGERLPPGIGRAKELLEACHWRTPSLDEVASHAGLSRAHLARTFRRAVACSVGDYLRRCRLDRAAELLRETDRGISDIALSTGFYDQSHFTGAFRRWVGCPPGAFRRMIRIS